MMTKSGSRQEQIMTLLLHSQQGLSIDEMAVELNISRTAVKQHLAGLEKERLIQEAALYSTGGRPARSYTLTQQGKNRFPKQYAWFCALLLSELSANLDTAALEQMMWNMGVKLGQSLLPQFNTKLPDQRMAALVDLMQNLGYHAELVQQDGQTSVKAVNCVYHDLAQQYPQLCQFDRALIATLLERTIEQTSCMADKGCECRFNVTDNQEKLPLKTG